MGTISARTLAKFIGQVEASFPGVKFGSLWYRALEKDKITAPREGRGDYGSPAAQKFCGGKKMFFILVMILAAVMGNLILSYFPTLLGQAGVVPASWGKQGVTGPVQRQLAVLMH